MRVPISIKLVVVTVGLLALVTVIVAFMASEFFTKTAKQREESINVDFAQSKGVLIQNEVSALSEKIYNSAYSIYYEIQSKTKNSVPVAPVVTPIVTPSDGPVNTDINSNSNLVAQLPVTQLPVAQLPVAQLPVTQAPLKNKIIDSQKAILGRIKFLKNIIIYDSQGLKLWELADKNFGSPLAQQVPTGTAPLPLNSPFPGEVAVPLLQKSAIVELDADQKTVINLKQIFVKARKSLSGEDSIYLFMPLIKDNSNQVTHFVEAIFESQLFTPLFKDLSEREFLVSDNFGRSVLDLPESRNSKFFALLIDHPIIKLNLAEKSGARGQKYIIDPGNKSDHLYSAYFKTTFQLTVISQVSEKIILEPAQAVQRRIFLIGGLVLSASILIVFLFSISLTSPIEKLASLMELVKKGHFDIMASKNTKTYFSDEVSDLALAVDQMTEGLKERDKVKNLFSKFVGSSVTDDLLKREVALGGARKDIVVFFSDIRGFTALSESAPPEEVVEMLNEYFGSMVSIINETGGVVDKFIGDAIMAVWGVPHSDPEDTYRAVGACIKMRIELMELNNKRISRNKVPLMIGMGIHFGPAVAGTIGSDERMEYTVIGNTVNTSSRIEASTKAFGTDLLISQEVFEKVEGRFIIEKAGQVEVKGRSEPLTLYKVMGFYNQSNEEVIVQTPYSEYEAEKADKVKIT